jgi:hypothetical protein
MILLISDSHLARIIGLMHCAQLDISLEEEEAYLCSTEKDKSDFNPETGVKNKMARPFLLTPIPRIHGLGLVVYLNPIF